MNKIKKIVRYCLKYFIYLPLTSPDFRETLMNVLKYRFSKNRDIVFYDRFSVHYGFSKLLIDKLVENNSITLIIGEKRHPLYDSQLHNNTNLNIVYLDNRYEIFFLLLNMPILITFASHFSKYFKRKDTYLIHCFHSLASIHYIYGDGAFDSYDAFFMVGQYHLEELQRTEKIRHWNHKHYFKVGYPKIEYLIKNQPEKKPNIIKIILFAPSWGKDNLLVLHGETIVHIALKNNYKIIVRPHPHSFEYDKDVVENIEIISQKNSNCILEDSNIKGMESFYQADIMIGDWSGASYEFAFALLKPVLFIDIPKKLGSDYQEQIDYEPFEVYCREEIGLVSSIKQLEINLDLLMNNSDNWNGKILKARNKYLYNVESSIEKAVQYIDEIKDEKYGR